MASAVNNILRPISSIEYSKFVAERYAKGDVNKESKNPVSSVNETVVEISSYSKIKAAYYADVPEEARVRDTDIAEKLSANVKNIFNAQTIYAQANTNTHRVVDLLA